MWGDMGRYGEMFRFLAPRSSQSRPERPSSRRPWRRQRRAPSAGCECVCVCVFLCRCRLCVAPSRHPLTGVRDAGCSSSQHLSLRCVLSISRAFSTASASGNLRKSQEISGNLASSRAPSRPPQLRPPPPSSPPRQPRRPPRCAPAPRWTRGPRRAPTTPHTGPEPTLDSILWRCGTRARRRRAQR